MSTQNKALVHKWFEEVWNNGRRASSRSTPHIATPFLM
jgi:hypothetical protein